MHPRVLRLAAFVGAAFSAIILVDVYRNGAYRDRFRQHLIGLIQPGTCTHPAKDTEEARHDARLDALESEFDVASDYQQYCSRFYGTEYLANAAKRPAEYCQDASRSSLLCFYVSSIGSGGKDGDPLCVARGARFAGMNNDQMTVSMQCDARNFTEERTESEQATNELRGFKNIEDIPPYFFGTGAGEQLRGWEFSTTPTLENTEEEELHCSKDSNDGKWYLLARREGNNNLWHKLMEIWQATLSVRALSVAVDPDTGAPLLTQEQRDSIQVVFEDDREEYLDRVWTMVSSNPPIRRRDLTKPMCPGNVILPLAGSSSPFWISIVGSGDVEPCQTHTLLSYLVPRTLAALGIHTQRQETDIHYNPVVTIINRQSTRVFELLSERVAKLQERHPNVTFNVVDFATIPLVEQIQLVQSTDVLVGHHGAGMTHVLFLPRGAAVVEIFPPPRFPILGFRNMSVMRGLLHFVAHSVWKEEWDALVNGIPIPADWERPSSDGKWQTRPASYVLEDEFIGAIEGAIRSQTSKSSTIWE